MEYRPDWQQSSCHRLFCYPSLARLVILDFMPAVPSLRQAKRLEDVSSPVNLHKEIQSVCFSIVHDIQSTIVISTPVSCCSASTASFPLARYGAASAWTCGRGDLLFGAGGRHPGQPLYPLPSQLACGPIVPGLQWAFVSNAAHQFTIKSNLQRITHCLS